MAPSYKLTYFNGKGAVEYVRFLFAYGGIEFEDKRVELADWPKLKEEIKSPFGQIPILEHNGKVVNQSVAMGRYVAKQVNLAGNNDFENLEIDSVVDSYEDLRLKAIAAYYEKDADKKKILYETLKNETIPFYFSRFENLTKKNNGYLAAGRLTWADLYFASNLVFIEFADGNVLDKYMPLLNLKRKVENLPGIKEWIQNRPVTLL